MSDVAIDSAKSVLISGASSGIGRATALRLAVEGWRVFAGVRRLVDTPQPPGEGSGDIEGVLLDVTQQESVDRAAEQLEARLAGARLTALINNAGVGLLAPMQAVALDDLIAAFDVNVFGLVRLTQAVLPVMGRGSRLVIIGSVGDRLTMPFGGPLTSSKWAAASIGEAFRMELRARRIPVTIIEPGSIHSDAVDKAENSAATAAEKFAETDPELAARFTRATDVAVRNERSGSSPDVVARAISGTLGRERPRRRVLVGKHARLLAALAVLLPDVAFDALRLQVFHNLRQN